MNIIKYRFISLIIILVAFTFCSGISYSQLINDFRIDQDTSSISSVNNARMSINKSGENVIVWQQDPSGVSYAQMLNENFKRVGNNFRVSAYDTCLKPDVHVRNNGSFGVVWKRQQISGDKVFLKIFRPDGSSLTPEIKLNDSLFKIIDNPKIESDSLGRFIVVWQLLQYYPQDFSIYCQIVDSSGNKIGNNIKVNEGFTSRGYPDICVRRDCSFIVTWQDNRPPSTGSNDVYFQRFDINGNKIGVNQRVNDNTEPIDDDTNPYIVSDSTGSFIIAFKRFIYSYGITQCFYQKFSYNGTKIDSNIAIPGLLGQYYITKFDCDEPGNYVFQFEAFNLFNIRVDKNNNAIGSPFLVSNEYSGIESRDGWDIKLHNGKIINIFTDARDNLYRPHLYINVRSYLNPDSTVYIGNISNYLPEDYKLYQNYPNPFNPVTTIEYSVPKSGRVVIKVFDAAGREIRTVEDVFRQAGKYNVMFDGTGLSSGVYFCRMEAGDAVRTRRMVLIK